MTAIFRSAGLSLICHAAVDPRMTTHRYPHLFVMGEQGVDVDSLLLTGLPWMGMPAGVWDPPFEPLNQVLQNILNPLGTNIVGTFGADQNVNHTDYSLKASKSASVMWLTPNFNGSTGWIRAHMCDQLTVS